MPSSTITSSLVCCAPANMAATSMRASMGGLVLFHVALGIPSSALGWCTAVVGVFQPSNRSRNMTCSEPAHSWDTGATHHCFVCSSASSAAHQ